MAGPQKTGSQERRNRRENDRIRKREKRMQLRQKKERLDNEIAAEDLLLSDGHPL